MFSHSVNLIYLLKWENQESEIVAVSINSTVKKQQKNLYKNTWINILFLQKHTSKYEGYNKYRLLQYKADYNYIRKIKHKTLKSLKNNAFRQLILSFVHGGQGIDGENFMEIDLNED